MVPQHKQPKSIVLFYQVDNRYEQYYGSQGHIYIHQWLKENYKHQEVTIKLKRKITINHYRKNITAGMIKVYYGLDLDGYMRNRNLNFIWYHLEIFNTLKDSKIILLLNQ